MARRNVSETVRRRISTNQPERSALSTRRVYWMAGLTAGCGCAKSATTRAKDVFILFGRQSRPGRLNHLAERRRSARLAESEIGREHLPGPPTKTDGRL